MKAEVISLRRLMPLAALGLSLFTTSAVRADILPTVGSPVVTPSGMGTYYWTYDVFVTAAQQVNSGDFFRIYDFAGYTGVASAPGAYSTTVTNFDAPVVIAGLGTVNPVDDASLPNITFTYSGSTIFGGPTLLGAFTLESTLGGPGELRPFVGRGTDQRTGLPNGNITNTLGPSLGVTVVPEPSAYAFAGILSASMVGLALKARRKRNA